MKNKGVESFVVGILGLAIIFLVTYVTNVKITAIVSIMVILLYAVYLKRLMKLNKIVASEKTAEQQQVQFKPQNTQQAQKVLQPAQDIQKINNGVQPRSVQAAIQKEIRSGYPLQSQQQTVQQRVPVRTDEDILREIADRQKRMKQRK